jgi:anti-sigma factor RsiW
MNCEETAKLMNGHLDNELDPITSQVIEEHLRGCPGCKESYAALGSLMRVVSSSMPYYKAPVELRERIQSSLRNQTADPRAIAPDIRMVPASNRTERLKAPWGARWNWLALAATIALAAIVTLNLARPRPGSDQFLATQLIASHARSLMANHLTDVLSSDQHTVKPWLDAKLDFAPAVVDLSRDGFPLIGGRLDYLDNRPVAALVYNRRKHFINLFVWPAESNANEATKTISRQGYHLLHWVDSDLNYWAVSDVNLDDLETFKQKFEEQTSHH